MKRLTKDQKVKLIGDAPEITTAVKILTALFMDLKLKNHISYTYDINGTEYILEFKPKIVSK